MKLRDSEDDESWRMFVDLYTPFLVQFCRWRGLSDQDAADVLQTVFAAVARAIRDFDYDARKGKFRNWLLTVTRRKIVDFVRKQKNQPVAVGGQTVTDLFDSTQPVEDEDDLWEKEYRKRVFYWVADSLKPAFADTTWQAFWRTAVDGERGTDVAADLNIPVSSVYVARSRITRRFREAVAAIADEHGPLYAIDGA